jgi:hypothetical protein
MTGTATNSAVLRMTITRGGPFVMIELGQIIERHATASSKNPRHDRSGGTRRRDAPG